MENYYKSHDVVWCEVIAFLLVNSVVVDLYVFRYSTDVFEYSYVQTSKVFCQLLFCHLRDSEFPLYCLGHLMCFPARSGTVNCFMLLLSGDIHLNPGLVLYPCRICCESVQNTQRGLLYDLCGLWCHIKCVNVSDVEYDNYRKLDEFNWLCFLIDYQTQRSLMMMTTVLPQLTCLIHQIYHALCT